MRVTTDKNTFRKLSFVSFLKKLDSTSLQVLFKHKQQSILHGFITGLCNCKIRVTKTKTNGMNNDVNRNVINIQWQSKEIYKREMGNLLIYSRLPV